MNRRFSGITSTVVQVIPRQAEKLGIATCGHPLPGDLPHLSWGQVIRLCQNALPNGKDRIFHARRNNEMLAGLILKWVFRCRLHLIFTSTAQRKHSRWTRFLYRKMDSLLSTSPRAASFLLRKPDAIIPHGIDTEAYQPAPDRASEWKEGGLPGKYGIGIFGRVRPQKGLREFVEALIQVLPDYPDHTAVIIGHTTPKYRSFVAELKELVRLRGLESRFCWLGKLPFEEIPTWFSRMSLAVCASHNEGFGLTCLEAMSSGVPVVATRAGAWEMIIEEGVDGFLIPCEDSSTMATAIRTALDKGPEALAQIGSNAHTKVMAEYTAAREASALNAVYRGILEE
mgnify:FL=1|tara:strand:+ start:1218 stop:2240 length:1023 start_codon:yes stop_codon:yes gene_type:complete